MMPLEQLSAYSPSAADENIWNGLKTEPNSFAARELKLVKKTTSERISPKGGCPARRGGQFGGPVVMGVCIKLAGAMQSNQLVRSRG
jgi:hypothetical protein